MITKIEIDGFKTFQDFSLELAPFQVIIGPNGSGKSNLFDAIYFLSQLADKDIASVFYDNEYEYFQRGEASELFTALPDGKSVETMKFAVEMRVDSAVTDQWGSEFFLPNMQLRYELEITRGDQSIFISRETLIGLNIPAGEEDSYIMSGEAGRFIIRPKSERGKTLLQSKELQRTVVSRVDTVEFPQVLAARMEMRSWRLLRLVPAEIAWPGHRGIPLSPSGAYLASTIARLKAENPAILHRISNDLAFLIPDIAKIDVEKSASAGNRDMIFAETRDGRRLSARVLSDGTLRMLVLATLLNDPRHQGTICFEDAENGIHPGLQKSLVGYLRDMATYPSELDNGKEPLRQLLATTHSPELVSKLDLENGELLFARMNTVIIPRVSSLRVTRISPVRINAEKRTAEGTLSLTQVFNYLQDEEREKRLEALKGAFRK